MVYKRNKILFGFGVMAASLIGAFLASSLLAPVQSVNADESASAEINVKVNPIISLSTEGADEDDNLVIEVDRAGGENMNTGKIDAKVTTNDPDGYALFMTTDKTDTTLSQDGITDRVKALAGKTLKRNFPENYWGYSTDGGATYYPVPSVEYNPEYAEAKALDEDNPANIKNYGSATTENVTEVTIGAKVSATLPSGHYGNTLLFTAVPNTNIAWMTEELEEEGD